MQLWLLCVSHIQSPGSGEHLTTADDCGQIQISGNSNLEFLFYRLIQSSFHETAFFFNFNFFKNYFILNSTFFPAVLTVLHWGVTQPCSPAGAEGGSQVIPVAAQAASSGLLLGDSWALLAASLCWVSPSWVPSISVPPLQDCSPWRAPCTVKGWSDPRDGRGERLRPLRSEIWLCVCKEVKAAPQQEQRKEMPCS